VSESYLCAIFSFLHLLSAVVIFIVTLLEAAASLRLGMTFTLVWAKKLFCYYSTILIIASFCSFRGKYTKCALFYDYFAPEYAITLKYFIYYICLE
jgi:hypothetical protein